MVVSLGGDYILPHACSLACSVKVSGCGLDLPRHVEHAAIGCHAQAAPSPLVGNPSLTLHTLSTFSL